MNDYKKVLLFGEPKAAGKSTFALTAPGPIVCLNFDGGSPQVPPGQTEQVFFQQYPPPNVNISLTSNNWKRPANIGQAILEDVQAIMSAHISRKPIVFKQHNDPPTTVEVPFPKTLILDGMNEFNRAIIDWILAINNYTDPSEWEDKATGRSNPRGFWGQRLDKMTAIFGMLKPLPLHFIMCAWVTDETKTAKDKDGKDIEVTTGFKAPDMGGKMDSFGPGKVDASLYCYHANGKYYVTTKPNGVARCAGVRGRYDLPDTVDVTLDSKRPLPWNRVWDTAKDIGKRLDITKL